MRKVAPDEVPLVEGCDACENSELRSGEIKID